MDTDGIDPKDYDRLIVAEIPSAVGCILSTLVLLYLLSYFW